MEKENKTNVERWGRELTKIDIKEQNDIDYSDDIFSLIGDMTEHAAPYEPTYNEYPDILDVINDNKFLPIKKLEMFTENLRDAFETLKGNGCGADSEPESFKRIIAAMEAINDTLSNIPYGDISDDIVRDADFCYEDAASTEEQFKNVCHNLDLIVKLVDKAISDFDYGGLSVLCCPFFALIYEDISGYMMNTRGYRFR